MSTTTKKIAQNAAIDVSQQKISAADAATTVPMRSLRVFLPEAFDFDACVAASAAQQQAAVNDDGEPLWNEQLTETAGFVPLEVRMKQMEQNGLLQQALLQDVTADDLREAWLSSDFEISPEDELEDVLAKDAARREFIENIKHERQKEFEEQQNKALGSLSKEQYQAVIDSLVEKYNIVPKSDPEQSDTQADSDS